MNKHHCQHWRACVAAVVTMMAVTASAQVEVEYFIDTDPGPRQALQVETPMDADGNITFSPPTTGLTPGMHQLGIRAFTVVDDITRYAPTIIHEFYVPRKGEAALVTRAEYFWDEDPGFGKGTPIAISVGSEVNLTDIELSTVGLSAGTHLLGIRAYGNIGWGPTMRQEVYVPRAVEAAKVTRVEYFWDDDPGLGYATPITIATGDEVNLTDIELSTADLSSGSHLLGIRAYGNVGWGPTMQQEVYVPASMEVARITYVEYFWSIDPGFGKGTPLAIAAAKEVNLESLEISTADLEPGEYELCVRAFGYDGWGPTARQRIYVPYKESDLQIINAEYFIDDDPGFGAATPIAITLGQEVRVEGLGIPTDGLDVGAHLLGVRYRGVKGWSPTMMMDFVVPVDASQLSVASAEYFWNEDPGFGNGTPINIIPGQDVTLDDFGVPSFDVHGDAILFVRYRGTFGWSPTTAYTIMVDAEGNYTLNAAAATSLEARNYQTLGDVVADFADRGVGDDVTLTIPTSNAVYAIDATTDDVISQFTSLAESLNRTDSPQTEKVITFKAAAGSGNTLSVTTTDEALPTVVDALSHSALENVTLTINGTAYDFSASSLRHEMACCGTPTTPIALSAISSAVNASWQAQPYQGTVLSGFPAEGSGDLPAMTITNNGTRLDSLAYQVTLSDLAGKALTTYTYYIYVYPRVSAQTFSGLSPATGSSLDPGEVTLKWNAIGGAIGGYHVEISSRPTNDTEADAVTEVIDTEQTRCTVSVISGRTYTWTVSAIGYCDELTSSAMTFTGRLLPDLIVESIALPEAAEAGNAITVTAVIRNNGEGATKETSWTDRLYYVVDSENFSAAVQAANVTHSGAVAVGDSYEVTFTMKVPYLDAGNLRVFVETDATSVVMESNNDNNRSLSTTSATLQPFYMNAADLAALRKLYLHFRGESWTSPWNTSSELITENNWKGVTFDTEGRVTAINLQNRGLVGELSTSTAPSLPALTTLNLSHNTLYGDIAPFVSALELTTLDLSYNQISNISSALPSSITSLNVSNQVLPEVVAFNLVNMVDDDFIAQLPSIILYDHKNRIFRSDFTLKCVNGSNAFILTYSNGETTLSATSALVYKGENEDVLDVYVQSSFATGSHFHIQFTYPQGDATFNGVTDILDLQATINYMFGKWNGRLFNYAAVNLFPDQVINIQDAIRLIDVIINEPWLDVPHDIPYAPRKVSGTGSPARLYVDGDMLKLSTTVPIAALDIVLSDCNELTDTGTLTAAGLTYNTRQADASLRLIAYSFNGGTLPVGETTLCHLRGENPHILHAQLSDLDANEVRVDIGDIATGLSEKSMPIAFKLYSTAGILMADGDTSELQSTTNHLPAGIYVLKLYYGNGRETLSKLRIESR